MTTKTRALHLKSRPEGIPDNSNFALEEGKIADIAPGEFLAKTIWLSVDPYMRGRMNEGKSYVEPFPVGEPLEGGCIGQVVESKNDTFKTGQYVSSMAPWADYFKSNGEDVQEVEDSVPLQHYLGALGMPGLTAYAGLRSIAKQQKGQTIFVSSAAGAVGSMVCQFCKESGCTVIGSAGSDAKVSWLRDTLQVDAAFNYKKQDNLTEALRSAASGGIDIYWDNVGAEHLEAALANLNNHGRIVGCGMIASYNAAEPPRAPRNLMQIIAKRLTYQGLLVFDHFDLRSEFLQECRSLMKQDKLVIEETIVEGLDNAVDAFLGLFEGDNIGKMLVRVAEQ